MSQSNRFLHFFAGAPSSAGAPQVPIIADQALSFGRLTLASAGGAAPENAGSAITSATIDSGTDADHWQVSSAGVFSPSATGVSEGLSASYTLGCTFSGAAGSDTATITINTIANAYSFASAAEFTAIIAIGVATLAGKTAYGRPGDYVWVDANWANKAYGSQFTVTSHDTSRGSAPAWDSLRAGSLLRPARFILGTSTIDRPKNLRFSHLEFYAPYTIGVTTNNTGALEVSGEADGWVIEDCEWYGNLSAIVASVGIENIDNYIIWKGLILMNASGTKIGAGGLTIQRNVFHDASRLIFVGHDTWTTGDATLGTLLVDKNEWYNWHVDAITPVGNVSGASFIRNNIHSPLSRVGSDFHGDGLQFLSYWDVSDVTVSRNFITMANLTGNAGTLRGHQGILAEDITWGLYTDFFSSDAVTSKGTGWSISGGYAVYAGGGTNSQLVKSGPLDDLTVAGETYKTVIILGAITNSTGNIVLRARRSGGSDPHSATFAIASVSVGQELELEWSPSASADDYELIIEASSTLASFTVDSWSTRRYHNRTNVDFTMNFIMANQTAGISTYNSIGSEIVGNTVIGRADWKAAETPNALYPSVFSSRSWYGEGGDNLISDNTTTNIATDFSADLVLNNQVADPDATSGATDMDNLFVSVPADPDGMTIAALIAAYTQKTGGALDTAIPKIGATAYVDWTSADRPWDHPRLNAVGAFTIVDKTDQVVSSTITSAAVQITDIDKSDGATSVNGALVWIDAENTTLASAQFRITSDSGGSSVVTDWTSTPAIIDQGEYLWVRGTSSGSASTATTARVYVGNRYDTWSVTTASASVSFGTLTTDGTAYLKRNGNLTGLSDGEVFTFVIRCLPVDSATFRVFVGDQQDNFQIVLRPAGQISGYMWGAAQRIGFQTTGVFEAADGMQTIFISGRSTSGSMAINCYKGSTDMGISSPTQVAGTFDLTPTDWKFLARAAGDLGFIGDVQFIWFDNVYYDVTDSAVRAKWGADQILSDGSGPGAQPKLFWRPANETEANADTHNAGSGGAMETVGTFT